MSTNKKINTYIRTILIAIILTGILSIYDSFVKSYGDNTLYCLADALFGTGLILLIFGLIFWIISNGGFSSFRYFLQKRKDRKENKQSVTYGEFITNNKKREYAHFFVVALLCILLSFILSYI